MRRRALAEGAAGAAWRAGLTGVVEGLAADWGLVPGRVLAGGTEGLVVEATLADGREAVLKLAGSRSDPTMRELDALPALGVSQPPIHALGHQGAENFFAPSGFIRLLGMFRRSGLAAPWA